MSDESGWLWLILGLLGVGGLGVAIAYGQTLRYGASDVRISPRAERGRRRCAKTTGRVVNLPEDGTRRGFRPFLLGFKP